MKSEAEIQKRIKEIDAKKQSSVNLAMILALQTEYDTLLWVLGDT
jgi:hypothetical protein